MEITYDSTITKLKDVSLPADADAVLRMVGERVKLGRNVVLRVRRKDGQETAMEEFSGDFSGFADRCASKGMTGAGLGVEILVRDPTTFGVKPITVPKELDGADMNALNWCGERGEGNLTTHPMQPVPMFLRANGAAVDLVNLHQGRAIFLVLNGPSFAGVDHASLRRPGIVTFGVNNGAQVFRPNYWACVDSPYRFCHSIWADPLITKFVPMAHFYKRPWVVSENRYGEKVHTMPNVIGYRRNEWFRPHQFLREDTVNWGNHKDRGGSRSVMLAALRICHLLGFSRVYLLGADFHMSDENRYFFDEQRTLSAIKNNNNAYAAMRRRFEELQPIFLEAGYNVINCTEGSAIEEFPRMPLAEALEAEAVDTSPSTHGMYCKEEQRQAEAANVGAGVADTAAIGGDSR